MFAAIAKQNPNHQRLRADFNRGLSEITEDGAYQRIIGQLEMGEPSS